MAPVLIALLVAAAVDPCAPVAPVPGGSASLADAYRRVGDDERSRGAMDTAAEAYRRALEQDPSNRKARDGLEALCRAPASDAFQEGVRRMRAGELDAALSAFAEVRAAGPSSSADLLSGICLYRKGDFQSAAPLLRSAEADPSLRDSARLYLGMIALREGEGARATRLLEELTRNPALGGVAVELARLANLESRLLFSVLGEVGYDSNGSLTPDGTLVPGGGSDAIFGLSALGLFRPTGPAGFFLRATLQLAERVRFDQFDFAGAGASFGWRWGASVPTLAIEAGTDYQVLGGQPYLWLHHVLISGLLTLGPVTFGASYALQYQYFRLDPLGDQTGLLQLGELSGSVPLGPWLVASLAYRVGFDSAQVPPLSYFQHGPRIDLQLLPLYWLRVGVRGAAWWRSYSAVDPSFGFARSDTMVDLLSWVEFVLGTEWTIRVAGGMFRSTSNVEELNYTSWTLTAGVSWTVGIL